MLLLGVLLSAIATAQAGTMASASTARLSVQAVVEPAVAVPNSELTIVFILVPARGINVYAPGAHYQVVTVKLDPQPGLKPRKLIYPPSETYHFAPLDEQVPVYRKPFTLKQPVAVRASALKGRKVLTLSGAVEYQACDAKVCYKPEAIPFTLELPVRR